MQNTKNQHKEFGCTRKTTLYKESYTVFKRCKQGCNHYHDYQNTDLQKNIQLFSKNGRDQLQINASQNPIVSINKTTLYNRYKVLKKDGILQTKFMIMKLDKVIYTLTASCLSDKVI